MTEPAPTERFEWLRAGARRRSDLVDVHHAVVKGWITDPGVREALVRELTALVDSEDLTLRETLRVCRIMVAMDRADLRDLRRALRRVPALPAASDRS